MLQGSSSLAPLVDDQLHVSALGVDPHPLAPHLHRPGQALHRKLGKREDRLGRVHDHLVRALGGHRAEQVRHGVAGRLRGIQRQRRIQVRHDPHGPAGRVGLAAAGAHRVQLGRRAVLVALGERVALHVDRDRRRAGGLAAGAHRALAGDDHLVSAERVDSDFRHSTHTVRRRGATWPRSGSVPGR